MNYFPPETRKIDFAFVLPLAAAILLKLVRLDAAAIWLDETFTANWVRLPWDGMIRAAMADNHLPLYFILLKAWSYAFGETPWALRLLSVVFSCAMVPVVARIAMTLSGRPAAIWAAWLTALSPFLLHHGQEARMYPLLGLLASINVLLVARFLMNRTHRLGLGFLAVNIAMLATHYYAVFLVSVEFPILFLLAHKRWRNWLPACIASCMLCIGPMLAAKYLATPVAGGGYGGIGQIGLPGMIWGLLSGYALMPSSEEFHRQGLKAAYPYLPLAFTIFCLTLVVAKNALHSISRTAWILLLGLLAGVLFGPLAISAVFSIGINPRYATAATPVFLVLLAIGLAGIFEQKHGRLLAAALVIFMAFASLQHLMDPGHGREDVFAAQSWLDKNVPSEEEILFMSEEFQLLTNYHWPKRHFTLFPPRKPVVTKNSGDAIADAMPIGKNGRTIFLISREWISDPNDLFEGALRKRFGDCGSTSVRGIRLLCLTPTKDTNSKP